MNKEEQRKFYERKLEVIEQDYNRVRATTNALRCDISDLSFDERVQDPQERYLLGEKLKTLEAVQTNMLDLIRLYRHKVKANKPEPWEEDSAHHCGQDADMDDACCQVKGVKPAITGDSLRNILGMQVYRCNVPCDVCAIDKRVGACVKLELVGGDCICLAPTPNTTTAIDDSPKSFEKPSISFDDEERKVFEHHGRCDISRRINEQNFSTYQEALNDAVRDIKVNGATHFSCPLAVLVAQKEIKVNVNPMAEIRQIGGEFMDYLDSVVKG